jgi:hypothetical protein
LDGFVLTEKIKEIGGFGRDGLGVVFFLQTWKIKRGDVGDAARVFFLFFITIIINNCHFH